MSLLWTKAADFEPRGSTLTAARALLALAQLTSIVFSSDRLLFAGTPEAPRTPCAGLNAATLWCLSGGNFHDNLLARAVAIGALLVVAMGYRPRWTCIGHFYIAFSINAEATAANGGDGVAQIATMLFIPLCLADQRQWAWLKPSIAPQPAWRGSAFAAHIVIRIQIAIIYADAAISKLAYPAWRHGTALAVLAHDPEFGFPTAVNPLTQDVLAHAWATDLLTWSVPAVELLIAMSMASPGRIRRYALVPVVILHGAIILLLGLFSFGLIMIALVLASHVGASSPAPRTTTDSSQPKPLPSTPMTGAAP